MCISGPCANSPWPSSHTSGHLTSLVSPCHSLSTGDMLPACSRSRDRTPYPHPLPANLLPLSLYPGPLLHEASLHCSLISDFPMLHSCSSNCTVFKNLLLKSRDQTCLSLVRNPAYGVCSVYCVQFNCCQTVVFLHPGHQHPRTMLPEKPSSGPSVAFWFRVFCHFPICSRLAPAGSLGRASTQHCLLYLFFKLSKPSSCHIFPPHHLNYI